MAPDDISQALGDFMLKGYILTNQSCPTRGCAIPMLRTPSGNLNTPAITFCVKCSDGSSTSTTPEAPASVSQASSASHPSRSSTPLTEVSEALGSTHSDFEPPPETDEMRQRREQSDRASSEIAKRLLQGWTMLADECRNEGCYGVPLARPPRAISTADVRKECVICGTIYKTEVDWAGREILVPDNGNAISVSRDMSPLPKRQRTSPPVERHSLDSDLDIPIRNKNSTTDSKPQLTATGDTLQGAAEALQMSLQALSLQLLKLSSGPNLDTPSIGMTADAIGKVAQALSHVRQIAT